MKKYYIIIFMYCLMVVFKCYSPIFAETNKEYYGRATNDNVCFYAVPNDGVKNVLFYIPKSYFVKIISVENETFYKASYMNTIIGYVKKDSLSYIDTIPNNPYADKSSFRIFTPSGANLRTSPQKNLGATNLITTIPFLETNLLFIGNIQGEEAISYKGTTWYYCKYIKDNITMYGYVYNALCDMLIPIKENLDEYEYITPNFDTNLNTDNTNKAESLTLGTPSQIAIIISVCLPCILIIYFLFKPTKISMQKSNKDDKPQTKKHRPKKKKIKHLKGSDYYELDGDFFN